jgi:hypothetical protein
MNFFLLLQIAIKSDPRHGTRKAGLWHGAAMSKKTDSTVDIFIEGLRRRDCGSAEARGCEYRYCNFPSGNSHQNSVVEKSMRRCTWTPCPRSRKPLPTHTGQALF